MRHLVSLRDKYVDQLDFSGLACLDSSNTSYVVCLFKSLGSLASHSRFGLKDAKFHDLLVNERSIWGLSCFCGK